MNTSPSGQASTGAADAPPRGRGARRTAGLAVTLAVLALLIMVSPGPLYRLGIVGLGAAFGMIRYGAFAGMAAVALGLLAAVASVVTRALPLTRRVSLMPGTKKSSPTPGWATMLP